MQRTGRVVSRSVESLEVVVLGLHLRTVGDLVAHAYEDVLDFPASLSDEVKTSERRIEPGKGDVDTVVLQSLGELQSLQFPLTFLGLRL